MESSIKKASEIFLENAPQKNKTDCIHQTFFPLKFGSEKDRPYY